MIRVAVIGAGWAGCSAALTLARLGYPVTVYEAARIPGGRARRVEQGGRSFDNGQHLLLGAYQRSLAIIESLHSCGGEAALQRLPLLLQSAPRLHHRLRVRAPDLPAPLHLLVALMFAEGLTIAERFATLRWAGRVLRGPSLQATSGTVADLISAQPPAARDLLWAPLCVAALNTPPEQASAKAFVEVLRRSFDGHRENSNLVVPRLDLTELLPAPALREVAERGGEICLGAPVNRVTLVEPAGVNVRLPHSEQTYAAAIIATAPQHVAKLIDWDSSGLTTALAALRYEPISTLHFEFAYAFPGIDPAVPMLMLDGAPGQWLFWHRLRNGNLQASVVISAHHREESETKVADATLAQLRRSYELPAPVWRRLITEKRATFACTPEQQRTLQGLPTRLGRIHFAGDWCVPELPATLESAVVSGERAATQLQGDFDVQHTPY